MDVGTKRMSRLAAIAAAALATVALSGCSLLSGLGGQSDAKRDTDTGDVVEGGKASAFEMHLGDCWKDPADAEEVSDIEVVPCSDQHDNEVIGLFDLEDGDYPGRAEAEALAQKGCEGLFSDYVGAAYSESSLEIFPVYPTEASWDNLKDREVVCSVYNADYSPLTKTVRDSRL